MPKKKIQREQETEFYDQKETVGDYPKKNYKMTKAQKKENQRHKPPTLNVTSAKTKVYYAKKPLDKYGDPFEYKMSKETANELLKECPTSIRPEQYLCDIINDEYGLRGWCQRVIIEA